MERDLLEFGKEVTVADKIHHATNALQFRSTSVAADEPLCLSNLLNLGKPSSVPSWRGGWNVCGLRSTRYRLLSCAVTGPGFHKTAFGGR